MFMSNDHTMSTDRWLGFLEEFLPSPRIGPMSNFTITATQRVELIDTLLNIPPQDLEVYMAAFQAWFDGLYPGAHESESLLSQLRELHTSLQECNDEQIASLRALPEGWLEHDPSQRFTGQHKKVVRPAGWTTFGQVVASARELAHGATTEE
jgi:hypothetical protein